MALNITITNVGRAEIIAAENTGTNKVTITAVVLGTGRYAPQKSQTALQAEVKRVASIAGKAVADDTIHIMALDESDSTYNVGEFGLISDKGTLIAVYSQLPEAGWIIQKAPASTLLLATDIILESLGTAAIEFGDITFINPPATVDTPGVVQLEHSLTSSSKTTALTAAMGKKLQDEKEPNIATGSETQYWRGNKTWRDFATDVRAAVLTGFSTATSTAVAAADTVLVALGKLQAQITGLATSKLDTNANAASATKLQTARTIGGIAFDGTANINLPGVNTAGNQSTSGNAATATKLTAGKNIALTGSVVGDVTTDFSGNVSIVTSIARINPTVDISATFRAAVFGGMTNGLRVIRSGNGGLPNFPQYGPCLAWSTDDTHALLSVSYNSASARLSAGSGAGLAWSRDLAFLDSPNFIGVPTVPTPPLAVSSKQAVNAEFVLAAVAALVDSSPAALDTLKELAAALGNDPNFATTMTNALAQKLGVAGGTLTGRVITAGSRDSGVYGNYNPALIDHVWSMGNSYRIATDGSDFGNLYGLAYKHTTNTSGGTMAGGHQLVLCSNGTPCAAIGFAGNFWTSGTYYGNGAGLTDVPQAGVAGLVAALAAKAALASPAFTGAPTTPTPAAASNTTHIPNTAWVRARIGEVPAAPKNTAGLSASAPIWWKCADTGLIIQTGRYVGTGTGSPLTITFPTAFPNACTSVAIYADNSSADHDLASQSNTNFVTRTSSNVAGCWVAYGY
ncbi:hypothetical protein J3Q00_11425 [Pseudomonas sp. D2-3]